MSTERKYAEAHGLEIAIIGMAARLPGADDVEQFWENLREGVESIDRLGEAEALAQGVPAELVRDPRFVPVSIRLRDSDCFDARFFGYSPREAELLDPQHRVFLECCWQVMEDAGYAPDQASVPVGVYAGAAMNLYVERLRDVPGFQKLISTDKDFLPTRVAYHLNLHGPAVNVQTACSTSLVAVHTACQSLLSGDCDLALAGGVAVNPYWDSYVFQEGMIHSADGHCRAYDAAAGGTVFGSGVAAVVLKRLADAVRDGDHVWAVIKGSAINNDGCRKVGYTAPSVSGQAEVIAAALRAAHLDAHTISYVEGHGTATELGDPVEVAALTKAYRAFTEERAFCGLGSVKSNFGHLDTVAGLAGLLKVVLALRHGELPPSLHFESPNPHIDFASSPFYVVSRRQPWTGRAGLSRRAGVSSFGIGGTNAHVVLEEAPPPEPAAASRAYQLLVCSAKTPEALERAVSRLAERLSRGDSCLADAAYTLAVGRSACAHRCVAVVEEAPSAEAFLPHRQAQQASVVFLFPGQGSQYQGMGRELFLAEEPFRRVLLQCAEQLECDLIGALYPPEGVADPDLLNRTDLAQCALFSVEYALSQLLLHWGLAPRAMIGHSVGEYVCACLAGVMTLEEALALVEVRGRLMRSMPAGSMLAVGMSEERLLRILPPELSLAAANAPAACVVSGPTAALERFAAILELQGQGVRRLHTSHAFHSAMMDPILETFRQEVEKLTLRAPQIPFVSNLSGDWITAEEATDPGYWVRHLRGCVRYSASLETVAAELGQPLLLELGPGHTLVSLARHHRQLGEMAMTGSWTLPGPQERQSAVAQLLTGLGRAWQAGAPVDWTRFYAGQRRRRIPLPTYPFERERHWLSPTAPPAPAREGPRGTVSDWLYVPSWTRSPLPVRRPAESGTGWLVLHRDQPYCQELVARLEASCQVVSVVPGASFERLSPSRFQVNPLRPEDFERMARVLERESQWPSRVLYAWGFLEGAGLRPGYDADDFYSLAYLIQVVPTAAALQFLLLTDHLQDVLGERVHAPERATLSGLNAIIPQEHPGFTSRWVDLDPSATPVDRVFRELLSHAEEPQVAYRLGSRWTRRYVPLPTELAPPSGSLRRGGTYLITGGLGGIGLVLARYLAEKFQARLVLVGRSGPVEPLTFPEDLGAEVLALAADVCDETSLRSVLEQTRQKFGDLHGVFHAAGVPCSLPVQTCTRDNCAPVMAAKIAGTRVLERCLAAENLDFLVLFSSLAAPLGGYALAPYAACNAYLDAYVEAGAGDLPTRVVSIDWCAWKEAGMIAQIKSGAVDVRVKAATSAYVQETDALLQDMTEFGLANAEGLEALDRILGSDCNRVLVAKRPPHPAPAVAAGSQSPSRRERAVNLRKYLSAAYAAPASETEKLLTEIWQQVLGFEEIGVNDDFFELGGHSLAAAQILARLYDQLRLQLPMRSLFEARNVSEMAEFLDNLRWAAESRDSAPGGREELVL